MALKNKSEEKIKEVQEAHIEDAVKLDDAAAETTEGYENSEEENMNTDAVEPLIAPGTKAFTEDRIRHLLDVALKRDTSSSIINIREKKFVIPENVEKYIAISGDVSGGKSTFLNAICSYPICPSAETTTSICPVELRRVAFPEKERIEICYISKGGERLSEKTGEYKVFSKMTFSPALFNEMCVFMNYLIEKRILKVDSLRYFENAPGSYYFDRNNWRHTMVLLMILFDTYLHEDKKDSHAEYKTACQMKEKLFTNLGLKEFNTKEYGIRLYLCSDLIPADTVIVDLPGTGSATEDSLHTRIVNNYLVRVSSLLFFIETKGNLSMEAQTTLNLFLNTIKSQKRDNPELVTFLMNKADEKDKETLQSAIKAFRDNYKNYADYALYAVSAISGEWLFMASGIEPQKTFMASKYKVLRIPVDSQTLSNRLEDAYTTDKYPYSLNGGDLNYNSASLSEFMGKHIEEYIRKLNFRGMVNLFDDYIKYLSNLCRTVAENIDILIRASDISRELGEKLKKAVSDSLEEAKDNLNKKRTAFVRDIEKMRLELLENIATIYESFSSAYEKYNTLTNDSIFNFVQLLEVENGVIPIDGNIIGTNQKGLRNRERLIKFLKNQGMNLAAQLTLRDGSSTFSDSFNKLDKEFDREREVYADFLENNIEILCSFSDYTEQKMKEKFKEILLEKGIPEEYFEHIEGIIANVCSLLKISCEEFATDLRNDASFEKAIIETSQKMQDGLSEILRPYTKKDGENYAEDVLTSIMKCHLFKANTIDMDRLKDFLSMQYINSFENKFKKMLAEIFTGDETTTREAHTALLDEAIRQFGSKLSKENMLKLSYEAEKSCVLLDNMGQPEEITKKLTQYREFANYIKNAFAENGHYRDIIDYIDNSYEAALKESRNDFAAIEKEVDAIADKISHFEKEGDNNG